MFDFWILASTLSLGDQMSFPFFPIRSPNSLLFKKVVLKNEKPELQQCFIEKLRDMMHRKIFFKNPVQSTYCTLQDLYQSSQLGTNSNAFCCMLRFHLARISIKSKWHLHFLHSRLHTLYTEDAVLTALLSRPKNLIAIIFTTYLHTNYYVLC